MNSNGSKSPKNAVISTKSAFSGVEKLEDSRIKSFSLLTNTQKKTGKPL